MCKVMCENCWRRQAQKFGLWCDECYRYLLNLYQDGYPHRCQAHHANGEPCQNLAQPNRLLCADCEAFYTGVRTS
jgi:hypothetical protein